MTGNQFITLQVLRFSPCFYLPPSDPLHPPTATRSGQNGFTDAFGNGSGTTARTQSTIQCVLAFGTQRMAEDGLAYNVYIRVARRIKGAKASGVVFGRARKDRWTPWEVYEASGVYPVCLLFMLHFIYFFSFLFLPVSADGIPLLARTKKKKHCVPDLSKWPGAVCARSRVYLRYLGFLSSINDNHSLSFSEA